MVGNECINNRKGLMYKNRGREKEREGERKRGRERGRERERERGGGGGDKERTDRQELHITGLFTILWLQ